MTARGRGQGEMKTPAVKALSPYHWTTREFPGVSFSALSPSAYLCILKCTFCTKLHSCVLLVYSDNLFLLIYAFCPLKINVIIVCLNMSLLCWCLFSLPDRLLSMGSQSQTQLSNFTSLSLLHLLFTLLYWLF